MALNPCPSAHCSGIQGNVNEVCKASGWGVNHPVIVQQADGSICYCTCSCLAFGTPVQTGTGDFRAIEQYQVGDSVRACGLSLKWGAHNVEFSAGGLLPKNRSMCYESLCRPLRAGDEP
jgi:hypothetical protein